MPRSTPTTRSSSAATTWCWRAACSSTYANGARCSRGSPAPPPSGQLAPARQRAAVPGPVGGVVNQMPAKERSHPALDLAVVDRPAQGPRAEQRRLLPAALDLSRGLLLGVHAEGPKKARQ